jgi:crossover junction endodeoxyribonuclease RuvC
LLNIKVDMMYILGLDPGVAIMGYGLVEDDGLKAIDYGVFTTLSEATPAERLKALYLELIDLIERHQPSEVAIELFIARNLRTALAVGQARGVALLAAAQKGLPVYEYTPLQIKQRVSGYGRGEKRQVQEMVRIQLGLPSFPEPDDAADALAVAICHIQEARLTKLLSSQR